MESRIKQLREKRGLIQERLAAELGITQQMLSKYERDVTFIKVDVLKKIAEYFNVTTDYLLGVSDVKRDLQGQMKLNETLDEYYDLIEVYKELDSYDQEMIWSIMQMVKKTGEKRKRNIQTTGRMETMIRKIAKRNFTNAETEVFWDGRSLADAVMEGSSFDIIYLDIEMDKEDGISAAKRIRLYDKNVLIRDILYFESNKRKIYIVTKDETLELYGKLNEIENSLKSCKVSFLRVHQSFLVNYKHVRGQSYDFVVMDNGMKISISEDRRKNISEQYCSMEDTFYVDE